MEVTDVELAKRMADGDDEALSLCYDRYASRILGFLVRLVGKRDDAEDLLQTTFCQAWRCARLFDPKRSCLEAWLLLLARSRALDYLRSRRPASESIRDGLFANDETGGELERRESAERLGAAMLELPEEQRLAIRLAFFSGLTHEEIARRLETPLGTIKTRIRLGMSRLRDRLREL